MTDFVMKLLKAEWEVNQQQGGEEFKRYTIWQMTAAVLHSDSKGQRKMETHRKDVKNLLYSRRQLTIADFLPHICTDHIWLEWWKNCNNRSTETKDISKVKVAVFLVCKVVAPEHIRLHVTDIQHTKYNDYKSNKYLQQYVKSTRVSLDTPGSRSCINNAVHCIYHKQLTVMNTEHS